MDLFTIVYVASPAEAKAMAEAGMNLIDIARQMGMTQDEVRIILDVGQKNRTVKEINR